jgi:hypothetical protein
MYQRMKYLKNAVQLGWIIPLLCGCANMGTPLVAHKSRLSAFAAKKDAVIESRSEEMGTNPVRVSLVNFLDMHTLQHVRGVEISVRSGGFPVYVDDDELVGLLRGVDQICSADVDPTAKQLVQKFFRTRDGVGVVISNGKNEAPACIELGGENVHVTMNELKAFGRMLHEAQGKMVGPPIDTKTEPAQLASPSLPANGRATSSRAAVPAGGNESHETGAPRR